jgi:hypothetical protein
MKAAGLKGRRYNCQSYEKAAARTAKGPNRATLIWNL